MKKITFNCFIKKSNEIHNNKYEYSITKYIDTKTNIDIICPIHGIFNQRPQHHLVGHGCNKCARKIITDSSKLTKETFISKAKEIHGNKYNYSDISFNYVNSNNDKVNIICSKHGNFSQIIRHHLSGSGCPVCKESKGEEIISKYLTEKNIIFLRQYRFSNCKHKKTLPFDFYLPNLNSCIEYQGEQHFRPTSHWGGEEEFKNVVKRDKIKKEYCEKYNIPLISINYNDSIIDKLKLIFQ
jgi:hypothetical protein